MKTLLNWFIYTAAIVITAYIVPGVYIQGVMTAIVLAVVLGGINTFVKPLLFVLTLPLNIFTLGLFTFVLNALLVLLATYIVPGFTVSGFWWAMLFAVVLGVVHGVLDSFSKE